METRGVLSRLRSFPRAGHLVRPGAPGHTVELSRHRVASPRILWSRRCSRSCFNNSSAEWRIEAPGAWTSFLELPSVTALRSQPAYEPKRYDRPCVCLVSRASRLAASRRLSPSRWWGARSTAPPPPHPGRRAPPRRPPRRRRGKPGGGPTSPPVSRTGITRSRASGRHGWRRAHDTDFGGISRPTAHGSPGTTRRSGCERPAWDAPVTR